MSRLGKEEEEDIPIGAPSLPEGLLVLKCVSGGGDSMIESLWEALLHHRGSNDPSLEVPATIQALKLLLIDELRTSPTRYGLTLNRDTKRFLKLSELPGQLPLHEILLAVAYCYHLQVWVHHGIGKPVVYSKEGECATCDSSSRLHLQCLSGVHYNPLYENRLFKGENYAPEAAPDNEPLPDLEEIESEDEVGFAELEQQTISTYTANCQCSRSTNIAQLLVLVEEEVCCALVDTGAQICLI